MFFFSEREKETTAPKPKCREWHKLFIHIWPFIIEASSKQLEAIFLKIPPLWSRVHKINAKDHNSCNSLLSESCKLSAARSATMSFSELSEWEKTLFSEYWLWGEGTKCKRFDQIDLLSRSSAGVWTSMSRASMAGNLHALICVIVRGGTQNESSIIHSGHIQQVIVCCCITSAP